MIVAKDLQNEILVGNKPLGKYLVTFGVLSSRYESVIIKARGKYIPKAICLSEACRKLYEWKVDSVNIGTESVNTGEKVITLPSIEISLKKS